VKEKPYSSANDSFAAPLLWPVLFNALRNQTYSVCVFGFKQGKVGTRRRDQHTQGNSDFDVSMCVLFERNANQQMYRY